MRKGFGCSEWFQDLGIISPDWPGVKHDFKFYTLLYGLVRAELEEWLNTV
jgi:hypothetical protein